MDSKHKLDKNRTFFDLWSSTYDFAPFQFWMKRFHRPVLKEINFLKNGTVLDISCGTGELLKKIYHLDTEHKLKLKGVDISSKMLEVAGKKLPKSILLELQNVVELQEKDNTYNYIISTEAFHHYPNQEKAMREMVRVTKQRGKVIVVDINFFFQPIHWLFQKWEPGCVYINNKQQMRKLFEHVGLKQIIQKRSFLFAIMTTGIKEKPVTLKQMY